MAEIAHFKNISIVDGTVRVNIKFDRFSKQFQEAQLALSKMVLEGCKSYMPKVTGSLEQRSYVDSSGARVVFDGPYARFLYMGKVMVDPDTGSPWARKYARKVVTDRLLKYSRPEATSHWFDAAKAANGDAWIAEVKRIGGGG